MERFSFQGRSALYWMDVRPGAQTKRRGDAEAGAGPAWRLNRAGHLVHASCLGSVVTSRLRAAIMLAAEAVGRPPSSRGQFEFPGAYQYGDHYLPGPRHRETSPGVSSGPLFGPC